MMPSNLEIEALVAIASCSASAVTVRLCFHRSVILEAHSAATAPPGLQYRPTDRCKGSTRYTHRGAYIEGARNAKVENVVRAAYPRSAPSQRAGLAFIEFKPGKHP
ncbi:hypothetical protein B0T09DRAFT_374540 [Sordaria sp. MPI-SDFR-AT-0083]|nr:hypothetical protein B0T09DRAFT_374540 [Sordaria sp. MPI-SDFR-AT-0083]